MYFAARKYAVVLAVVAGSGAIPAAVLRFVSSAWGTPWDLADMWGLLQWVSIGVLTLTVPISFVWMIIAVAKQQWDTLGLLVVAFWIPVLAFVAGMMFNFDVLDSG